MKFEVDYYFKEINQNELFHRLTQDRNKIMDIFDSAKEVIGEINTQEIHTTKINENVKIIGNVYIGEDAEIADGCIIEGPAYIGKNCKLMYHSYIRPGTILEDNCVVGFSSEIKNTIMREGSKVSDLAFVGDSIIGKNSRIGSGVVVANRGFNQSEIAIKDENKEIVKLGREFIGVILGDNSRIGANCTTSPGTFIGRFTWIYPHTCVHGFIPEQKKVYDRQNLVLVENERKVLSKSTDSNCQNYK